jgi:hypothetical protein
LKGRRVRLPALRRKGRWERKMAGKNISFFVWERRYEIWNRRYEVLTLTSQKRKDPTSA